MIKYVHSQKKKKKWFGLTVQRNRHPSWWGKWHQVAGTVARAERWELTSSTDYMHKAEWTESEVRFSTHKLWPQWFISSSKVILPKPPKQGQLWIKGLNVHASVGPGVYFSFKLPQSLCHTLYQYCKWKMTNKVFCLLNKYRLIIYMAETNPWGEQLNKMHNVCSLTCLGAKSSTNNYTLINESGNKLIRYHWVLN